jgi:nucleoside-diphosphate-sugar epimerase
LAVHTSDYNGFDIYTVAAAKGLNSKPTLELAAVRWKKIPVIRRPEIYSSCSTASILDTSKIRERLGFIPEVSLEELLLKAKSQKY